jgi:hypothetical protein
VVKLEMQDLHYTANGADVLFTKEPLDYTDLRHRPVDPSPADGFFRSLAIARRFPARQSRRGFLLPERKRR